MSVSCVLDIWNEQILGSECFELCLQNWYVSILNGKWKITCTRTYGTNCICLLKICLTVGIIYLQMWHKGLLFEWSCVKDRTDKFHKLQTWMLTDNINFPQYVVFKMNLISLMQVFCCQRASSLCYLSLEIWKKSRIAFKIVTPQWAYVWLHFHVKKKRKKRQLL